MPCYNRDPKRDHNFDNHTFVSGRECLYLGHTTHNIQLRSIMSIDWAYIAPCEPKPPTSREADGLTWKYVALRRWTSPLYHTKLSLATFSCTFQQTLKLTHTHTHTHKDMDMMMTRDPLVLRLLEYSVALDNDGVRSSGFASCEPHTNLSENERSKFRPHDKNSFALFLVLSNYGNPKS